MTSASEGIGGGGGWRRAGRARPSTSDTALAAHPVLAALAAILLVSALFLAFPGVDLAASRLFRDAAGFPLQSDPALAFARDVASVLTAVVVLLATASLILPLLGRSARFLLKPHAALYALALYALGPGLLVNGLMKNVFGRARPRELIEFGQNAVFSPVWQVAGSCRGNCSFVSGEGAAAAALLCLLPLVPRPLRGIAAASLGAVALALSAGRLAMGAHFLSDVILSWLVVFLVAALLHPLFLGAGAARIDRGFARLAWRRPSSPPAAGPADTKAS